ncbi:MAG: DMT family transporter [Candidatus Doudnabacteria bacterium]|nr:DMT family transporter [Candidatus Doudnabacteria bacterium]
MDQNKLGPWLIAAAAVLWAIDAPFRKFLTGNLSSTTIVFMEHIVIGILVAIFLARYLQELKKLNKKDWLAVVFIGFGGSALATVFFTQSFHYVNPSVSILLQKVQPIFTILLAVVVLKEKLSPKFWLWTVLAMFGAYLVSFPGIKPQMFPDETFNPNTLGVIFALLAAFFWGGSTVFGRLLLSKISFQAMTAVRFLSAVILLLAMQVYYGRLDEIRSASQKEWLFVLIVAVLAGFISLFIYYKGLRHTKASIATLCELAFPFAAVIINWRYIPGSELSLMQILGGLILLGSITALSFENSKQTATLKLNELDNRIS